MGGSITVQSAVGVGSTFTVVLPLSASGKAVDQPAVPSALVGLRALVVDDNRVNRRVLLQHLSSWGMRADCYGSAHEALDAAVVARTQGDPYQVVVADYHMPGMDGVGLARQLRKDGAAIVFVMLTSVGHWRENTTLPDGLIDACLTKPVRHQRLMDALARAWRSQGRVEDAVSKAAPRKAAAPSPMPVVKDRKLPRVLVVEDNPTNQKVARLQLDKLGVHVEMAGNGREAVDMLRMADFDVVLMDCFMPEMNGYETTRVIRRMSGPVSRVPIVAMNADAVNDARERCLEAGMDAYVSKPVNAERLADALGRFIRLPETTHA